MYNSCKVLKIPFRSSGYSSFRKTTTGVPSSDKNRSNIIQPDFQFTTSKFQVNPRLLVFFHVSWNNGLPQSCGTSAKGAQKDTRASQVGRKKRRMEPEDVRLLTSKTSKCPQKSRENGERSKHSWLITATSSAITSATSDFFSASERPNVSGWDGAIQEPKGGNRKNEVHRPSYWKRELLRWNHDILIKTQQSPGESSLSICNIIFTISYMFFLNTPTTRA